MNGINSIESFNFKLECFGGPIFEVYYLKYSVFYSVCKYIYGKGIEHNKKITKDAFEMFKSKLNDLKLINWQNEYYCPALDGEDWNIDLTFNSSFTKKIEGSNGYPGDNSIYIGRTEIFNELLLALDVLIQEPDFFQMNS